LNVSKLILAQIIDWKCINRFLLMNIVCKFAALNFLTTISLI